MSDAKKELMERMKKSQEQRDQGQFVTVFKNPTELPMWKCGEGRHKIDILPYKAGSKDPRAKKGTRTYILDIWVHYQIGANDDAYVCLDKTYGQDCPICEYRKRLTDEGTADEKTIEGLKARRRVIYNVWVHDSKDERKKGVQIWDVSHFFMERNILPLAENPEEGGMIVFSDLDDGRTVVFTKKGSGIGKTSFLGHQLVVREYDIPDRIKDGVFILDELLIVPEYEDVEKRLYGRRGKKTADGEEEDVPERLGRPPAEEEDDLPPKKKKRVADEEEDDPPPKKKRAVEKEEEDDPPPKKKKKVVEEEEDDPPPRKKKVVEEEEEPTPKKKVKCPVGGKMGEDFDTFQECVDCQHFNVCADLAEELAKATPKKKKGVEEEEDDPPPKKKKVVEEEEDDPPRKLKRRA